jgi:hypothetical protein
MLVFWNLRAAWTGGRRWPAKVWSIVLAVSAAAGLRVAVVFHLVTFGVHY